MKGSEPTKPVSVLALQNQLIRYIIPSSWAWGNKIQDGDVLIGEDTGEERPR